MCLEKPINSSNFGTKRTFYTSNQQIFLWRISRAFQILDSCIVLTDILQNMRMGQWMKTCKPWFYTKNNFKNKHCWPFIFSITKTLYILNQCFFPEESVEPFRFRLWPIATALGALIVTSLIFFATVLRLHARIFYPPFFTPPPVLT